MDTRTSTDLEGDANPAATGARPARRSRAGRIALLSLSALALVLAAGYVGVRSYIKAQVDRRLEQLRQDPVNPVDVRYRSLDLSPLSLKIALQEVTITTPRGRQESPVHVRELSAANCDVAHDVPRSCHLEARGIELAGLAASFGVPTQMPAEAIADFGPLDLSITYTVGDRPHDETSFEGELGVGRLGSLAVSLEADGGVDITLMATQPPAETRLHRLAVTFQDTGLIDKAISAAARDARVDEPAMRAQWNTMLARTLELLPVPTRDIDQQQHIVDAFLARPERIEFAFQPPQPLPFMQMQQLLQRTGPLALAALGFQLKLNGQAVPLSQTAR